MSAPMIDHASAAALVKAAYRARDVMLDRIDEEPDSPIAADLRIIADHAQQIINDNERRTP